MKIIFRLSFCLTLLLNVRAYASNNPFKQFLPELKPKYFVISSGNDEILVDTVHGDHVELVVDDQIIFSGDFSDETIDSLDEILSNPEMWINEEPILMVAWTELDDSDKVKR